MPTPGTSQERRRFLKATERKETLLQAVIEEALALRSVRAISMRGVAERAGVTTPILYRFFSDRSELIREAYEWSVSRVTDDLKSAAMDRDTPAKVRLQQIAERLDRRGSGGREIFEILVASECDRDPKLADQVRKVITTYKENLTMIVRDGIQSREFRKDTDAVFVAWRLVQVAFFRNHATLFDLAEPFEIRLAWRSFDVIVNEISTNKA